MTQVQRCSRSGSVLTIVLLILCILAESAGAQTPRIQLQAVVSDLNLPAYITHAHDRSNRRFIIEQAGIISVMQPGSISRTTFLDIRSRVISPGERGLLGLAFHPQFSSNGRFFVDYTRRPDGATVIAEYHVSANPNVADVSERILLIIPQPYENHNGGMIEFGPDGYLYIGMGDGGSGNDPQNRAQNVDELLGKILRIDVDSASPPATNPYAGSIPGRDEIYAIGLRNPWRFSFDRVTGQLYVGDVGQDNREEIDIVTLGGNYGWRVLEGTRCTNQGPASCSSPGFTPPITEYSHTVGCSITGGYVYRGTQQSLPYGAYVYGDFCTGVIFILQGGVSSLLLSTNLGISSFGEDEAGELYVVDLGGTIYRIINPDSVFVSVQNFSLPDRGTSSFANEGGPNPISGYARIQAGDGSALPSGMAILGRRDAGVLVSEVSIPATPFISTGRVYVEQASLAMTGIAIANPNNQPVTVNFYFTDALGTNYASGSTTIGANRQLTRFLDQDPFNKPSDAGRVPTSFTFTASQAVAAFALRGLTNERGEFLMASANVTDLSNAPAGVQTIAQYASGGGWNTELILVNPSEVPISGTIETFDSTGQKVTLLASNYQISPRSAAGIFARSSIILNGPNNDGPIQTGSVRITPSSGSPAPAAAAVFTFNKDNVTVSQASVAATPAGTAFRVFADNLGNASTSGSIQTGIAIANPSATPVQVSVQLFFPDGLPTGLAGMIPLPGNGQTAVFLNQMPGFASLPSRFQGVLRVTAPSSIEVAGLRGRYNERNDFIITTTDPVSENDVARSSELMFPQLAVGGGYEVQFVLFSGRSQQASSGAVYFYDLNGNPVGIPLRQ